MEFVAISNFVTLKPNNVKEYIKDRRGSIKQFVEFIELQKLHKIDSVRKHVIKENEKCSSCGVLKDSPYGILISKFKGCQKIEPNENLPKDVLADNVNNNMVT